MQKIAAATAHVSSFAAVVQGILDDVCAHTGWPIGHALTRVAGGPLGSSGIWHLDDAERYRELRRITESASFADGVGLPGRVAQLARPLWIMDVTRDPNFPRAAAAAGLNVHAAFAFPVVAHERVAAVLEFFSPEALEPDGPLLDVMATIGTLLGGVIERVEADAALRRSEARVRSVVDTANDAIVSVDGAGRVVSWNAAAQHIFGWSEIDMLGQPLSRVMPERFREPHERGLARVRAGGERHVIGRTVELAGLHRDGREFPIELSIATWSEGGQAFFTGIARDISERKAAEEELRRFAARLEASERRATDASRAKSTFLANMSHELRTPLNAILGFVQLMRRDAGLSSEQSEHLGIVLASGEHLLELINDVLSIAKIEAGGVALTEVDFDLGRLIAGLRDLFLHRARAKGVELVVDSGELPRVRGDEAKLRQVLINLVGNAVKFTNAGRVTLRAAWRDGEARFEVEDTGRGIDPAELERIFEPFVQGAAASGGEGGTGLGLAITRSFLGAMGGALAVRSAVGEGSSFAFSVPLGSATSTEAAPPEWRILWLAPGHPEVEVLVVDNDGDSRTLLCRLLGDIGYRVRSAEDGQQALDAWSEKQPGLVLMDMRMPVLDGYAATRRIRELERQLGRPRTAILALTASAFEHDRPAILAAGCDDIIAKPFRENLLLEAVARALGVRYAYEEQAAPPAPSAALGERLSVLPDDERAALHAALVRGDDLAAQQAAERLAARDAWAGAEVSRMIKGFQLEELLAVLEGSP